MLKTFSLIIKLIPVILAGVRLIEEISRDTDWSSQTKKDAALAFIRETAASLGVPISDDVLAVISRVIDTVVSVLNAFGVFSKKAADATVSAATTAVSAQSVTAHVVSPDPSIEARLDALGKQLSDGD